MSDDQSEAVPHASGGPHLSRRTLIRTAAHTAWVVPVISAVSAAPAFAASQDVLTVTAAPLTWGTETVSGTPTVYLDVRVTVTNGPGGTLPSAVQVQITSIADGPATVSRVLRRTGTGVTEGTWNPNGDSTSPYSFTRSTNLANNATTFVTLRIRWRSTRAPATGATVTVSGTVTGSAGFNPQVQAFSFASTRP
jgi:hypothetical protein